MTEFLQHPELERDGSFAHLALGKRPPLDDPRTLRLAKYLDDDVLLPEIPETADFAAAVPSWPMYGNNSLGDCTIADAAHLIQAWTAAAGSPVTPDEAEVIVAYWATGSSDDGRFELDVLGYWRNSGIAGHRIGAYAAIDPQNLDHVRAAIWLFGGVYAGVALPNTAKTQAVWDVVGDGETGDSQPGSWGGHAVPFLAYDADGLTTVTWGAAVRATYGFHLAYTDELYAIISPDFFAEGRSPAGFDVEALQADLAAVTSGIHVDAVVEELHGAPAEEEGASYASMTEDERIHAYDLLVADGLSDVEARATVWPEPEAAPEPPQPAWEGTWAHEPPREPRTAPGGFTNE